MMSFFKIVLLGLIYLRATLDLGYILTFRLAHCLALATEYCTLFQTFSLGVCSARFESNSYLDPWRLGL